ncbi:hypothetical protein ABMB44_07145 [Levilactobacillus brevis]
MDIEEIYTPLNRILLISLHPEYVSAIMNQTKIIKYRKRFFKDAFQAFVCTTGPNGGIELFIDCDAPIISNANNLATIGSLLQNDDYTEIHDYFNDNNSGFIIPIKSAVSFPKIPRKRLLNEFSNFVVPQSYLFLDDPKKADLLKFLLSISYKDHWTLNWEDKYDSISQIIQ